MARRSGAKADWTLPSVGNVSRLPEWWSASSLGGD